MRIEKATIGRKEEKLLLGKKIKRQAEGGGFF